MTVRGYFRRALLLLTVLLLAWFSVAAGLGGFFAQRAERGDETAIDPALGWQPGHPGALLRKALAMLGRDPDAAVALLGRAYRANASDPSPLLVLATRLGEQDQWERSDALIDVVSRLVPADSQVQLQIALHWATRGQFDKVLLHWSSALEADASRQAVLFPVMLQMADAPELRSLFTPFVQSPPAWWGGFFRYLSAKALNLETARYFYHLMKKNRQEPVTSEERAAYVARLERDGMIAEAYVVWIGGLGAGEREKLGLLFDGGFELPLKQGKFGWQLSEDKHFTATPASTPGGSGSLALRLQFHGFQGYFSGLWQPLYLDPGVYRLTGRARPDGFASEGGLRWQIRCLLPERKVLGDGPRYLGSAAWSNFDLRFEVPDACVYQQLILVSAGERSFERKFDGALWFDDLKVSRVSDLDAAARANAVLRSNSRDDGQ